MGDLKVCKPVLDQDYFDFSVENVRPTFDARKYTPHPRDLIGRAQWRHGICEDHPDSEDDYGPQHGTKYVEEGGYNASCFFLCHTRPETEAPYVEKSSDEGLVRELRLVLEPVMAQSLTVEEIRELIKLMRASAPGCDSCHGLHDTSFDISTLTIADIGKISMTPDGKLAGGLQYSPFPPMVKTLGCPDCHESKRPRAGEVPGGSLAREVTDVHRHTTQPCQTCHQAALSPVPEIAHPPTEESEEGGE